MWYVVCGMWYVVFDIFATFDTTWSNGLSCLRLSQPGLRLSQPCLRLQAWVDSPEGGMDGQTNLWNISPFYRTLSSALLPPMKTNNK